MRLFIVIKASKGIIQGAALIMRHVNTIIYIDLTISFFGSKF